MRPRRHEIFCDAAYFYFGPNGVSWSHHFFGGRHALWHHIYWGHNGLGVPHPTRKIHPGTLQHLQ